MSTTDIVSLETPCPTVETINVNVLDTTHGIEWLEIISAVLAVLALLASIYALYQTRQTHKSTLSSVFFESIFKDYLIDHFPNSRERISFENKKIKGHEAFVDHLCALRREILYFKYADRTFYDSLRKELQELEDFVVTAMNREYDSTDQTEFNVNLDEQLAAIILRINKRHCRM